MDFSQLPDVVLLSIFKQISYRWNISPVCKKFYQLICDIENDMHTAVIDVSLTVQISKKKLMNLTSCLVRIRLWLNCNSTFIDNDETKIW